MTSKNKSSGQFDKPGHKGFLTLSFRLCLPFLVICIFASFGYAESLSDNIDPIDILESSLLPGMGDINAPDILERPKDIFRVQQPVIKIAGPPSDQWQTEINGNVAANLAARLEQKPSDLLIAKNPATDTSRQLWKARIGISEDSKADQSRNELMQIIKQINSVEFKPQSQTSEPAIVVGPAGEAEAGGTASDANMAEKAKSAAVPQKSLDSGQQNEKQQLPGQITKQTLQVFEQLSQQPQQIKNSLELAEILYRGGQMKEAAQCYRQALKNITADGNAPHGDKAWILFQIGNCLQKDDPPAAIQMYKQLIEEYPNSPWTDLARVKNKLIDWYLKEKPDMRINGRKL